MTRDAVTANCLLVVAPHPDDEVLGCAYLMRQVQASGGDVVIVWLTDGGASHGDRGVRARAALVATRQCEALAGLSAIDVQPSATYFLAYPDGALGDHADQRREATTRLATICAQHGVDALAVTSASDGHPDHRAAFHLASGLQVANAYAYFVSGGYDGDAHDAPPGAICIDEPGAAALKRAALACHASQREPGARFPLSAAAIDRFCASPELFVPIKRARTDA